MKDNPLVPGTVVKDTTALMPLLGEEWHMIGINDSINFCYVNIQTVQYHLHERKGLDQYWPDGRKSGGHILIFRFVRMDGLC